MRFTSTRDGSISVSFEEALCSGYAPDGGLFVPESLPSITADMLQQWSSLNYAELTHRVLRLFCDDTELPDADLQEICRLAFAGFDDPEHAVPVVKVGPLFCAELFHGPTFCFKDLGMRVVIYLLSHFSRQRQRRISLLVSTTGDTGPAAVQAVSDADNALLNILVHYPDGQISYFQRKQLTTVRSSHVRVAAFQGGGDDMDKPIKNVLTQQDGKGTLLTGVNSYNIVRPLTQMVHYIWTYLRVTQQLDADFSTRLDVILPTGAMGNMAGGYMAKQMGLPLGRLNAGVNANDIVHRTIQTGAFYKHDMVQTLSEAINVQVPYNFERLLFYLTNSNHALVRQWMADVDTRAQLDLDVEWLQRLQDGFGSARVTDEEMCATMRRIQAEYDYWADPHTAVALAAAERLGYMNDDDTNVTRQNPAAVLATASPCKFQEAVTVAMGTDGWKTYEESKDFPAKAREILNKPEKAPTLYKATAGCSLEENQTKWEQMAREILVELEQQTT